MSKKSWIIILAVVAITIVACGHTEDKNDLQDFYQGEKSNNGAGEALENIFESKSEQEIVGEKQDELLFFLSKETLYTPKGNPYTMIEYDNKGNMVKKTYYNSSDGSIDYGYEYFYRYDAVGNMIMSEYGLASEVGKIGATTLFEYDAVGNMIKQSSDGYSYSYEYDAVGNVVKQIDKEGAWIDFEYDVAGNEVKSISTTEDGYVLYDLESEYEYNAMGNKIKRTDYLINNDSTRELRFWTEYEYDKQGNALKETIYTAEGEILQWTTYEYEKMDSNFSVKEYQYAESTIKADDINIIVHLINAIEIYFVDPVSSGKSGSLRCIDGNLTIDGEIQDALDDVGSLNRMGITITNIPKIKSLDYQNWEINFSELEMTFGGDNGEVIKEYVAPHLIRNMQIK